MRAGRVLLLGIVLLLAVLAGAALVLPGLLDWTRYRGTIEALASSSIGRLVRIEGGVSLSLLPQPVLTAGRISVPEMNDGVSLTARELRVRVSLPALFAGRLDARELTLNGADLHLPWPPAPGALAQAPPTWLAGLQARVEDSRMEVGSLAMTGINANLSTDRDTGTLAVAGEGTYAGRPWHVTALLGQTGRDGSATLEASVDGQGAAQDTGAAFSGQLGSDGALSGRVSGRGPDLSQILPTPALAWQAEGRLLIQGGLAIADELAMQIGGSPARGAVALRVSPDARLDLAVAASQLDLDAWLPVLVRGAAPTLPTSLDLSAESATLAGGTLRRLRGAFDLNPDQVAVREATADLPGEAPLVVSGHVARAVPAANGTPATPPRFEGEARLSAPDLRTTLRWLEPLLPALASVPQDAFRTAQLEANVRLQPGQFALTDLRGTLDGSRVSGGLSVHADGAKPHLGAGLTLDTLQLDAWLPRPEALLQPAALAALAQRSAALDVEVRLEARRATWQGLPVSGLVLDAQAEGGRVAIRRLDARLAGARISVAGTVGEGGRIADGKLDASIPDAAALRQAVIAAVPDGASGLAQQLAPLLQGAASVQATVAGPPEAVALRLTADLGDLHLEAQPSVNLVARRWAGPVLLRHPGAPRLLEGIGLGSAAAWLGDGSFSLVAQSDLQPGRIAADAFDLSAGLLRASGQVAVQLGDVPAVQGRISAETLPLPLPYLRSPDPLPMATLRRVRGAVQVQAGHVLAGLMPVLDQASAVLSLEGGVLKLERLAGTLSGGALTGAATVDASAEPPRLTVQTALAGASIAEPLLDLPLDLVAGQVDGQVELAATGYSPAGLLATLSGKVAAVIDNASVAGFDLAAAAGALRDSRVPARMEAELRAALGGGSTTAARVEAQGSLGRGVLQLDGARATVPAGTAGVSGTIDLPAGTLDLRVAVRPAATEGATPPDAAPIAAPDAALRLTGPATQPRRTPELAAVLRWLAEQPPP